MKNIIKVGNRSKHTPTKVRTKTYLKRQENRFICKFWSISLLLVRILKTDPGPGQPNECGIADPYGSGYTVCNTGKMETSKLTLLNPNPAAQLDPQLMRVRDSYNRFRAICTNRLYFVQVGCPRNKQTKNFGLKQTKTRSVSVVIRFVL